VSAQLFKKEQILRVGGFVREGNLGYTRADILIRAGKSLRSGSQKQEIDLGGLGGVCQGTILPTSRGS